MNSQSLVHHLVASQLRLDEASIEDIVRAKGYKLGYVPDAVVTHVRVDVAPGLATSPANVPQCTLKEFGEGPLAASGYRN